MGKIELIALLYLSSWCLVMVEWLFLAVPWGCLQFVIVVFPDHTRLLFFKPRENGETNIVTVNHIYSEIGTLFLCVCPYNYEDGRFYAI